MTFGEQVRDSIERRCDTLNAPLTADGPHPDDNRVPASGLGKKAGTLMSRQPVHAIAGLTLRHWTTNSREFVGGSQRPAPPLPYSEQVDGVQFHRLALKLARVRSELARRVS